MKNIYYCWYAKKRLVALQKDLLKMGDDNPMLEAQGDMIQLEIEYYREESIKSMIVYGMLLIASAIVGYTFQNTLYTFVESLKIQLFYFIGRV